MTMEDVERVKRSVVRRYEISAGLALSGVKIELSNSIDTACVVGKEGKKGTIEVDKLLINPDFFERLSFSERVFVLAHEALHIALKHFSRSIDKPVKDAEKKYQEYCQKETDENKRKIMKLKYHKKYQNIWNIATDACINAFLRRDGFKFPENVIDPKSGKKMQFVDLKDGLIKSAEKIYDDLVRKEEEKEKKQEQEKEKNQEQESNQEQENNKEQEKQQDSDNKQSAKSDSSSNGTDIDDIDIDDYNGFDSHDQWTGDNEKQDDKESSKDDEKSSEENQEEQESQEGQENQEEQESQEGQENQEIQENEENIDEEDIFNKELQRRKEKQSKKSDLKDSFSKIRVKNGLADYVPTKPVISWKRLLTGTLEKDIEMWGNRRSSRFNPNARIEERTEEARSSVEVILDVSGSVSIDLLKGFLLQLYPILETLSEDEELFFKVGTFANDFSGFQVISGKKDIASYRPEIGGGTDFEVAATSFTKDPGRKITKIVFTDGCLGRPQVTRVPDIIWIVFGNDMDFTPVGGRIIKVSEEDYKDMINTSLFVEENEEDKAMIK